MMIGKIQLVGLMKCLPIRLCFTYIQRQELFSFLIEFLTVGAKWLTACALFLIFSFDVVAFSAFIVVVMHLLLDAVERCYF